MSSALPGLLCAAIALAGTEAARGTEALVDPTRPASATVASDVPPQSVGVHVQAVLSRSGSRIAIVNGRLVRAGDRFGNISIEEVTADGVRYLQDGRTNFARVPGSRLIVRRPPVSKKELP